MKWSWLGSTDKDIKSGIMTLRFSTREVKLPMDSFVDAEQLGTAINTELAEYRQGGIQTALIKIKALADE